MAHRSIRTGKSRHSQTAREFGTVTERGPWLETATDICWWSTLVCVAIGFGGRMASGQLALVLGASVTSFSWLLQTLTSRERRYTWTGSEWPWIAGIAVVVAQLVPWPTGWLLWISPQLKEILPLWFDANSSDLFPGGWHQLSLAPWETTSGLATFLSYAMLFLVMAQRTRTITDVERSLCLVSMASIVMMVFALLQFFISNGKFFWVYDHPYMATYTYPLGCFTNRNHLAQFLVLGTAPLIWWLLRRLQQQEQSQSTGTAMPHGLHVASVLLLLFSLGGIAMTVLMTLSRGGLLALALSFGVALALMCRIGLASLKFGVAMLAVGLITGILFSSSKYESVLTSRLAQDSGRNEIWQANIRVARDFPVLGTGIGTHPDAYHLQIDSHGDDGLEYSHAESGYLQIASESGIAGLIVAALFIVTSLWWCCAGLRNRDTNIRAAAAAILASLIANILHAAGDFFWYTPVCILLLAVQLACAGRLSRLTRQAAGRPGFSLQLPRPITALAACGLVALSYWMFDQKQPAAIAEIHDIQSVLLSNVDDRDLNDDERLASKQQRLKEIVLAGKANPRDARLQESATNAYIQLFDLQQERSENPMSLAMLRDAVKASQFESVAATIDWLNRAAGVNLKLLRLASRTLKRTLSNSPLRSKGYVLLTELSFLERADEPEFQKRCLVQALRLRPHDADTLYLIGKSGIQNGDFDEALVYWRDAFKRSPRMQARIAEVLAGQMTPDFFEQEFQPNWQSLGIIAQAFTKAGRVEESQQVQRRYIAEGLKRSRNLKSDDELLETMIAVRSACRDLQDTDAAVSVMLRAVKRLPHSYTIRYLLSLDLIDANRLAEAAPHLKWCAVRHPEDAHLQQLMALAVTERLRQTPTPIQIERNVEQTGLRQ